jgi:hypothetical protein
MHVSLNTAFVSFVYFPATFERNTGRKSTSGLPKWQITAQIFKFFFHERKRIKTFTVYIQDDSRGN